MGQCSSCGAQLFAGESFCRSCGAPVQADSTPVAAVETPVETAVAPPTPLETAVVSAGAVTVKAPRTPLLSSRRALWASRGLLALTLIGTGFIGGWAVGADRDLVHETAPPTTPGQPAADTTEGSIAMPDLRGLRAIDARQILADLGVHAETVQTTNQPSVGERGLVLRQDPVFGYPVVGQVTLSVSTPATVPSFAGRDAKDVLADLDQLGAEVHTTSRYVPGVTVGDVAAIKPAPGTLLPVDVTVVIAAEPDTVDLADVDTVESGCFTDSDSLNGTQYDEGLLTCEADRSPVNQTWVIKRAGVTLSGILGIPDSGDPRERVQVQIVADGAVVKTLTCSYGETVPFEVSVDGTLRLTLRIQSLTRDYATAGLANLRINGDAKQLAKLGASQ